jgi:hypothetical protein
MDDGYARQDGDRKPETEMAVRGRASLGAR